MNEDSIKRKMQDVIDIVTSDIASIRTGRATTSLVEDLQINAYGGQQKLKVNELATLSTPDTQTIVIDPWDKSIIGDIKQGILAANVGLNPSIDGEIVRISLPPMTTDDRQKFVKLLKSKIESGKVMVRQLRGEEMKDIKTLFEEKSLTEDEKFAQEKRLQEITDKYTDKIEEIGKSKEEELMRI